MPSHGRAPRRRSPSGQNHDQLHEEELSRYLEGQWLFDDGRQWSHNSPVTLLNDHVASAKREKARSAPATPGGRKKHAHFEDEDQASNTPWRPVTAPTSPRRSPTPPSPSFLKRRGSMGSDESSALGLFIYEAEELTDSLSDNGSADGIEETSQRSQKVRDDEDEPLSLQVGIDGPVSPGHESLHSLREPTNKRRVLTSRSTPMLTSGMPDLRLPMTMVDLVKANPAQVVTTHVDILARAESSPDLSHLWGTSVLDARSAPLSIQTVNSIESRFRIL